MLRHSAIKFLLLSLAAVSIACEHSTRDSSQRLLFDVEAYNGQPGYLTNRLPLQSKYQINAPGVAFDSSFSPPDSGFVPSRLQITFDQEGDLVPSLLGAFGYKVVTRIEFDDGSSITVNHTNVADSLRVAAGGTAGDTLYVAIRGEGLVSNGEGVFENVTGLFFEQSTYGIVHDTLVANISCRYELSIEY
ncbi:MAG: hypothetical protein FVQ81_02285 [Candidatus Glassbacteria bacterium]|nr:hypothetical protein [Candidatus Glassbacteria bacterium]